MVANAPRVLTYAYLRSFISSKGHYRSLIYLKKALNDSLFQLEGSIGRFAVHRYL